MFLIDFIMGEIRGRMYRNGKRPQPSSIFYSPSLDMMYSGLEFNHYFGRDYLSEFDRIIFDAIHEVDLSRPSAYPIRHLKE